MPSRRNEFRQIALATVLAAAHAGGAVAGAQTLRGSPGSVEKMYAFAVQNRMPFYDTPDDVSAAAERGRLVQLAGGPGWDLSGGVGWAYATPEAVAFLDRLGPEYEQHCAAPLVVTSATRPKSKSPRNGHPHTVHPTGIAVDLRKPYRGPCLDWLRARLAEMEAQGTIEATEERRPPHFHIAVLSRPGSAPPRAERAYEATTASVSRQLGVTSNVPWGAALHMRGSSLASPMLNSALSPFGRGTLRMPGAMVMAERPVEARGSVTMMSSGGSIAPSAASSGATYVIRAGDTLWDVARRHHVSVEALLAANKLGKRGTVRPGMELNIPATTTAAR